VRLSRLRVEARVSPHRIKKLLRLGEQCRINVAVGSSHGAQAIVSRQAKRPVLIGGFVLALLLLVSATQFVLDVRVSGISGDRAVKVLQKAYDSGARRGALWGSLSQHELQLRLERELGFVQKALAHKRGSLLEIEIIPYIDPPQPFVKGEPCDIVASRGAVVENVIAIEGTPVVKPGDVVRRGDVLIRGTYIRKPGEGKQRFVQARGMVMGRVSAMGTASVGLSCIAYEPTGRTQTVRTLELFNNSLPLGPVCAFEHAVQAGVDEAVVVGLVLPARVISRTYAETRAVERKIGYALAESTGIALAKADAQIKMPEGFTAAGQTVYSELTPGGFVTVRVYLTAIVPVGTENRQMMTDPLLYIPKYW
jgi:sporulation protein YqfD